ncbi:24204_t:CDS:2 [Gigaspora margarita]|uniref:24204_t:CDS:1 n=1 Tax=Gigaspora margarita TaxID=4874 RepID=A0ABN7UH36_GIGMA|nr:24204_t:CDS:2 [Gigaspora margarita]
MSQCDKILSGCADKKPYAHQKLSFIFEQLENQYAQHYEAYRLHAKAESNEQANPQYKAQRAHKSNATYIKVYDTTSVIHYQLGLIEVKCLQCEALHWIEEKVASSALTPIFKDSRSHNFQKNIRKYNSLLAFTLMGAKIDKSIVGTKEVYCFQILVKCTIR